MHFFRVLLDLVQVNIVFMKKWNIVVVLINYFDTLRLMLCNTDNVKIILKVQIFYFISPYIVIAIIFVSDPKL